MEDDLRTTASMARAALVVVLIASSGTLALGGAASSPRQQRPVGPPGATPGVTRPIGPPGGTPAAILPELMNRSRATASAGPNGDHQKASAALEDLRLQRAVEERLKLSKEADLHGVKVRAASGAVSLQGTLSNAADKSAAEAITKSVNGVKRVDSEIEIKRAASGK